MYIWILTLNRLYIYKTIWQKSIDGSVSYLVEGIGKYWLRQGQDYHAEKYSQILSAFLFVLQGMIPIQQCIYNPN